MIITSGDSRDGNQVLFLGLTGENVTRLAAGEPIKIEPEMMKKFGLPPITVIIHYGKTEDDIVADFRKAIEHVTKEKGTALDMVVVDEGEENDDA